MSRWANEDEAFIIAGRASTARSTLRSAQKDYGVDVGVFDKNRFDVPERGGMDMGVNVGVIVGVGDGIKGIHPL